MLNERDYQPYVPLRDYIDKEVARIERDAESRGKLGWELANEKVQRLEETIANLRRERVEATHAVHTEMKAIVSNHRDSHEREHMLHKEAQDQFQKSTDQKFQLYNAFREQINQERSLLVRRDVLDERLAALSTTVEAKVSANKQLIDRLDEELEKRVRPLETARSQSTAVIAAGFALIAIIEFLSKVL